MLTQKVTVRRITASKLEAVGKIRIIKKLHAHVVITGAQKASEVYTAQVLYVHALT